MHDGSLPLRVHSSHSNPTEPNWLLNVDVALELRGVCKSQLPEPLLIDTSAGISRCSGRATCFAHRTDPLFSSLDELRLERDPLQPPTTSYESLYLFGGEPVPLPPATVLGGVAAAE